QHREPDPKRRNKTQRSLRAVSGAGKLHQPLVGRRRSDLRTAPAGRPFSGRPPAMPKPFKLFSTRTLPADGDILDHDGKPHVRLKDRSRSILCPLTKDGRNYLRPSKCWYFKYRDGTGTVRRMKGFADLKATEQLAAETERKASRVRSGYT